MKKTLAAVAVLGAFAGSAIAADVTLVVSMKVCSINALMVTNLINLPKTLGVLNPAT